MADISSKGVKQRTPTLGRVGTISLLVLAGLLILCLAGLWVTRGAMTDLAFLRAKREGADQALVSLRPWQTAQTLAALAVTAEEKQYANEAERLADHEVDQSFEAALRAADLQEQHRVLTGRALAISQRIGELQKEIAQDQTTVARLQASGAGAVAPDARGAKGQEARAAEVAARSDALKVAEAQLKLDQDELTDSQRDLDRATGDLSVRIRDELDAHEASMKKFDAEQQNGGGVAVVSVKRDGTLYQRLKGWLDQRGRRASIEQARAEALTEAKRITAEHNALETKMNAAAAVTGTDGASLQQIQDRSKEREILWINDDRIQTEQQLAAVYAKWGDQVALQHRILLHLLLQSLEMILLISMGMIACDALVRRALEHPAVDQKQRHTLHTIVRLLVIAVWVLMVVMVLFGLPHQLGTIIGLLTAGLTIALQDYILSFLGWFMLVGKNGIRVGDMVEIDGICGEVLHVGLMSTTLLETTGLAEKGEPTGRRVSLLNSFAIRGQYFNFSSEGQWMWDEITVSVPATKDIYDIAKSVEELAREETRESARQAEEEWKQSTKASTLTRMNAAPIVMLRPSVPVVNVATGIDIQVRYVTHAIGRYEVRDRLYRHVIKLLQDKGHVADGTMVKVAGATT